MEEKKKDKGKPFRIILISLFLIFLTLYISQETGYYEYQQQKKVTLTDEKIKEFEKDVADGKRIDIDNYLEDIEVDYNNGVSRAGLRLSKKIEDLFNGGMKIVFGFLEAMFSD
jgi:archaellum component FlaF (FlaF/FlaG flagellin family)